MAVFLRGTEMVFAKPAVRVCEKSDELVLLWSLWCPYPSASALPVAHPLCT